ncbi:tetratricopeptide repeat protein [Thermosulfurimonas marina]|uniref:tetratricopeptide repeat protein n=1 Tax=Thermosulfurimonas marina TaxID=2047767 RepID=UPI00144AE721|nr:tetratricopeptide repeat protein [Thermosulfurimonas marina]
MVRKVGIFLLLVSVALPGLAAEAPEKDPAWWLEQARFAYGEGDLLGALRILKETEKRFPGRLVPPLRALEARVLFESGKVEEVIKRLEPLTASYALSPEDLLLLARAHLRLHNYPQALFWARLVEKRAQGELRCEAQVMLAQSYLATKLRRKAAQKALEVLRESCSEKTLAGALEVLLESGQALEEVQKILKERPALRLYAPGIFKILGDRWLAQGKLEKAKEAYFRYLNLSGSEEEAPGIFLKLAEAAFHRGRLRWARTYYELLLTVWPHLDEAKFAKFRLYHLSYEFKRRLGAPTLKERKVLIPLINELRRTHPDHPITREAHAFEVRLYLEDKKPEKAFWTALDFLKRYPRDPLRKEVESRLCEADNLFLGQLFAEKAYARILKIHRQEGALLEKARCGAHFYWLGKTYGVFHLDLTRTAYLLRAYEFGVPRAYRPELYLALIREALEEGRLEEASEILEIFPREFPFYRDHPRLLLLKARWLYQAGHLQEARRLFEGLLSRKDFPKELRPEALGIFFQLALQLKDLDLAFRILEDPSYRATDEDFAFLIQMALENEDYLRAKRYLAAGKKRFPDSTPLRWLEGVYYERRGQEEALKVWQSLASANSTEGRLAQGILRGLQLIDRARRVIY